MKVYMFRHQHAGIVTSHVFAQLPSGEQLSPLLEQATRVHGPGWIRVHEAEFIEGDAVPQIEQPAAARFSVSIQAGVARAKEERTEISGVGTVTNPPEATA